ncbi:MAG: sigma-E processing peptidase SpoIIGA [bacterium]|nr:sigma-E processing peptidase SpoIIGA [bacterium]
MRIYIDLVFLLNLIFDFLLLLSVSLILKRNVRIYRIIIGSLFGSLSTFLIFYNISSLKLFFIKVIISILMILITFSYKGFKYFINNVIYLYLCSIVLGGGLYLIDNNIKLDILLIIIGGPLILYFYINQSKKLKYNYSNYYNALLIYKNKTYRFTAFLDTGNKLKDQYKKRPIILVNTDKIDFSYEESLLVPYKTASGTGIIKCLTVDKIIINDEIIINKPLIGKMENKFGLEGIDMILNNETL